MCLFLGISGGHTRSASVVLEGDQALGLALGEGLNLHANDSRENAFRLQRMLSTLASRVGVGSFPELLRRVSRATLAVPGGATGYDRGHWQYCLKDTGWKAQSECEVLDDTCAGLVGGGLTSRGVCAFAGTGASVFVAPGGPGWVGSRKFDGRGPILGDFGSGFRLVARFFEFLGREVDVKGAPPPLFESLSVYDASLSSFDRVQSWFDGLGRPPYLKDWRSRFAALAAAITGAADRQPDPDPDAVRLVRETAEEMVQTITIALGHYGDLADTLPVICQGGMFRHSRLYRETVFDAVLTRLGNSIRLAAYHPVVGAALIARAEGAILPSQVCLTQIIQSMTALPASEQAILTLANGPASFPRQSS